MSDRDIAVSVRDLSKSYVISHNAQHHETVASAVMAALKSARQRPITETFWALKDVNFEIRQGDVVGIIGRNGAGKSTLLKILSRVVEPTTGKIDLYGRVGSLLEVGTGFHPDLTGRENVFLNGAMLGMTKREIAGRFDEIVEFAEIDKFLDTPVKRYSSGMYVRLAFAVAAHLEPEILIVDEVLAVGDAAFQNKCLGKMKDVSQHDGRTILFVSHNMGPIRSLCSNVLWFQKGQIIMSGEAPVVMDAYMKVNAQDAQTDIDLDGRPRHPEMGERLRLRRALFNGGGSILHGEPLTIRIEYATPSRLEGVVFGVGLSTREGVRLMTLESDSGGVRVDLGRGDAGYVDVTIDPLMLQPGRYSFDVGARSGDNTTVDFVQGSGEIEVLPGPDTPGTFYESGGGLRLPATWGWSDAALERRQQDSFASRL